MTSTINPPIGPRTATGKKLLDDEMTDRLGLALGQNAEKSEDEFTKDIVATENEAAASVMTTLAALAEVSYRALAAWSAMPDAGLVAEDPRFEWWNRTSDIRADLRSALADCDKMTSDFCSHLAHESFEKGMAVMRPWVDALIALYDGTPGGRPATDAGQLLAIADALDRVDDRVDAHLATDNGKAREGKREMQDELRRIAALLMMNVAESDLSAAPKTVDTESSLPTL